MRLQNWLARSCRPDCKFTRDDWMHYGHDPLSITALHGSEDALRLMVATCDSSPPYFREKSLEDAVWKVFLSADTAKLKALLLDEIVGHIMQQFWFFRELIGWWSHASLEEPIEPLCNLVKEVFGVMIEQNWGNKLLCYAAGSGCLPLIELLFDEVAHSPALRKELLRSPTRCSEGKADSHQSVDEAANKRHVHVVAFLLQQDGIKLIYCTETGQTTMYCIWLRARATRPCCDF